MKNVGMKPESYRVAEAQAILFILISLTANGIVLGGVVWAASMLATLRSVSGRRLLLSLNLE